MTPKEKAQELFEKFMQPINRLHKYPMCFDTAKQCSLIAVDECIKHEKQIVEQIKSLQLSNSFIAIINEGSFWTQVKHEIENL